MKTIERCKPLVDELVGKASWSAINGNAGYLKWLEEECIGK